MYINPVRKPNTIPYIITKLQNSIIYEDAKTHIQHKFIPKKNINLIDLNKYIHLTPRGIPNAIANIIKGNTIPPVFKLKSLLSYDLKYEVI